VFRILCKWAYVTFLYLFNPSLKMQKNILYVLFDRGFDEIICQDDIFRSSIVCYWWMTVDQAQVRLTKAMFISAS
jgi:hypothetical protein